MSTVYDGIVMAAAAQNGVDPNAAMGIYRVENGSGNPSVVSSTGAVGLLQIEPSTAKLVDPTYNPATGVNASGQSLTDPTYNVQIGTSYMAGLQNGNYLAPGSGPVNSNSDLFAAYYSGGVYKGVNGYTTRGGLPGGPPTVNQYVANASSAAAGGPAYGTAGSSSGTPSAVSPHSIPDQLGKYTGIDNLYNPIGTFNVPSPFIAYVQMTIGGEPAPGQVDVVNPPNPISLTTSLNPINTAPGSVTTFSTGVKVAAPTPAPPQATKVTTISPDLSPTSRKIRVTDFNFEEGMEAGSGKFLLKLYLETSTELNWLAALVAQYNQINLTWGYQQTENTQVRQFTGTILRFSHQFQSTGYGVLIEGMDAAFSGMSSAGADSYAPVTGRVSDIVSYIAAAHKWKTVIEKTIPLPSGDDPHKGQRVWNRISGQTEMAFINEKLCAVAQSDVRSYQGVPFGHYRAFFISDGKGSGTLHFHSILVNTTEGAVSPVRTYTWGGLGNEPRASVVRDFVMDYAGYAYHSLGVGQLTAVSTDPTSGQVNTVVMEGNRVTDHPLGTQHLLGSQDSAATFATSGKSQIEVQAKTLQKYLQLRDACFTANLFILGDPFLRCGDVIHVTVQRPGQQPEQFYDWIVMHMTHNIAGGDYMLSCQLILSTISSLVDAGFRIQKSGATMSDFANLAQPTNPVTAQSLDGQ